MRAETSIGGLRRLFRLPETRRRIERDIDAELRSHFESRITDLMARGVSPAEARRIAEAEYGDVEASRAELTQVDRRTIAFGSGAADHRRRGELGARAEGESGKSGVGAARRVSVLLGSEIGTIDESLGAASL